ncbi:MAG: ferritin family protein [Anaerolineae bacterium]
MQSQAPLAALIYAAINEQEGYRFYTEVAEHISDSRGQAMFRGLAEDEVKHYQILLAQHANLSAGKGWLPLEVALETVVPPIAATILQVPADQQAAVPQERLFPRAAEVMAQIDAGSGDIDAVDMALVAEQRGYDIYARAAKATDDTNAQAAYQMLMREESRHFEWLQRSRGYLVSNETYWDDSEFPFFEG